MDTSALVLPSSVVRGERAVADRASAVPATARNVTGVILAGVHQWGGTALDRALPRPLVPVANRALITYSMRWLREAGVRGLTVCGNSHTGVIRTCLGSPTWEGIDIEYYEDPMPRGPAGCVRDAAFGGKGDIVVVVDGTIVPCVDLDAIIEAHLQSEAMLTVVVSSNGTASSTRSTAMRPLGMYVFTRRALEHVAPRGYQDIKEKLIPDLYAKGERVVTFSVRSAAPRVTGSDTYLAVNEWVVQQFVTNANLPAGYRREGEAVIHDSATIDPTAQVIGPVLIGPGCVLAGDVAVVGPTSIGSYGTIHAGAVICRSAVWDGCTVGRAAVLDRCILANGVEVSAGVSRREAVFTGETMQLPVRESAWA
jgi:mannose-1-phosphate guanylyltransferase